jgi:hypothetical protein
VSPALSGDAPSGVEYSPSAPNLSPPPQQGPSGSGGA